MEILQDFIFSANLIKHYNNTSRNIFKKIIVYIKNRKLLKKLSIFDNVILDYDIIKEFIKIYNGSYDMIKIDSIYTNITNNNYLLSIKRYNSDSINIIVSDKNSGTNNILSLIIYHDNARHNISILDNKLIGSDISNKEIVQEVNNIIILYIKEYMESYILL